MVVALFLLLPILHLVPPLLQNIQKDPDGAEHVVKVSTGEGAQILASKTHDERVQKMDTEQLGILESVRVSHYEALDDSCS